MFHLLQLLLNCLDCFLRALALGSLTHSYSLLITTNTLRVFNFTKELFLHLKLIDVLLGRFAGKNVDYVGGLRLLHLKCMLQLDMWRRLRHGTELLDLSHVLGGERRLNLQVLLDLCD